MLEFTALHFITPLFRATFMAMLLIILTYIFKFFLDGYRYIKIRSLLILLTTFLLLIFGSISSLILSSYGQYLISFHGLEVEGLSYHYLGNIVYSVFQMCAFFLLIVFNVFSKFETMPKVLPVIAIPFVIEALYNVEIAINIIVLLELIYLVVNIALATPSYAHIGRLMVITGLLLLISSRLLMLFPFFPTTDMFSSMMEVAGFSGLLILRQDINLLLKTEVKGGEVEI